MPSRREFLHLTAAAGGAAALSGALPEPLQGALLRPRIEPAPRALNILILGGTGFTGPYQVRYAVERGHNVTVFNRGRTQTDLPASVSHLQGDRNEPDGLASIEAEVARGVRWDVVIDNPTTLPHWVRDAGSVLQDATDHFVFTSTISVYSDTSVRGMDEDTPLAEYQGEDPLQETMDSFREAGDVLYGPLKAASEREAEKWFPGRTTVIRPGLIVGPRDRSGRFTYWAVRLERGGEVLAPGDGHDLAQLIDARDLAEWTVRMAENRTTGIYNATGPAGELTMAEMLGGVRGALGGTEPTRLTWVPADFLEEHQVRPFADMPIWVPPEPEYAGFLQVSIQRALDAGLTFRPLATTTRDLLDWYHAQPAEEQPELAGPFTAEREEEVLRAWHDRESADAEG